LKLLRKHWSHFGENNFGNLHLKVRQIDVTIILAQIFGKKEVDI